MSLPKYTELENLKTGERFNIKSKYLVACDGGSSNIRKSLGFKMGGRGPCVQMLVFIFALQIF